MFLSQRLITEMPGLVSGKRRIKDLSMCLSDSLDQCNLAHFKGPPCFISKFAHDFNSPILPGLPDDVAKHCLALVPRSNFPAMGGVCKRWRSFIKSKEFITVRKLAGMLEEWLYVLTMDPEGNRSHWEVLDCFGRKHHELPPMPGAIKFGFGVVVLHGKLLVVAGYSMDDGSISPSAEVYQYDSCLNRYVLCFFYYVNTFKICILVATASSRSEVNSTAIRLI